MEQETHCDGKCSKEIDLNYVTMFLCKEIQNTSDLEV